jgi:hypothetical protein
MKVHNAVKLRQFLRSFPFLVFFREPPFAPVRWSALNRAVPTTELAHSDLVVLRQSTHAYGYVAHSPTFTNFLSFR